MAKKPTSLARKGALALTGLLMVALTGLLIDTMIYIWPSIGVHSELCKRSLTIPEADRAEFLETVKRAGKVNCKFGDLPVTRVNLGGTHTYLSADQGLFAMAGIMAAIGALLRSLLSLGMSQVAKTEAELSLPWTLLRPIMAAALGIAVYLVLRTFFQPDANLIRINPYGYLSVALLTGLFADRILLCLGEGARALVVRKA